MRLIGTALVAIAPVLLSIIQAGEKRKKGTFHFMPCEPSMTSDRCHGPTPGCRFPPPVTGHSEWLPPGFNKTWGIPKNGSECWLEFL